MTANDCKSYLRYLNKLADQYKKKMKRVIKLLNLKLMIESELLIIRIFLVMVALKIGRNKNLLLILF